MAVIDLQLLSTLLTLAEEGNVSRAARRIGLTQAAVSAQLARLREHYGDELFVATGGRGVRPTPLAVELAQRARALLEDAKRVSALRAGFDPATAQRRFAVLAGSRDIAMLLAPLSRRLSREAPGVQLTLSGLAPERDLRDFDVDAQLERQDIDFAIVPQGFHAERLPTQELYSDRYVLLADRGHPLVHSGWQAAGSEALVHVVVQHEGRGLPSVATRHLQRVGRHIVAGPVVDAFASIPFFLVDTPYVALVTERFGRDAATRHPLAVLELPFEMPTHVTVLQWRRDLDVDAGAMWMRGQLAALAREPL